MTELVFTDREISEILLALVYTRRADLSHGTSGHLSHTVIAKLVFAREEGVCKELDEAVKRHLYLEEKMHDAEMMLSQDKGAGAA